MIFNFNQVEVVYINGLRVEHYIPAQPIMSQVLVFHPGMFSGDWIFDFTCRMLMEKGYESYVVIPRGHGTSLCIENLGVVSIDDYINDLLGFIRTLDREVVLIGHSMGALISNQAIPEKHKQVVGFASLMSAPYRWSIMSWKCMSVLPSFIWHITTKLPFKPTLPVARKLFFNRMCDKQAIINAWKNLGNESGTAAWEIIRGKYSIYKPHCRLLVMSAKYDNITPYQRSIYNDLKGRSFGKLYSRQFTEVHTSHMFMCDDNWRDVPRALHKWLEISFPQV